MSCIECKNKILYDSDERGERRWIAKITITTGTSPQIKLSIFVEHTTPTLKPLLKISTTIISDRKTLKTSNIVALLCFSASFLTLSYGIQYCLSRQKYSIIFKPNKCHDVAWCILIVLRPPHSRDMSSVNLLVIFFSLCIGLQLFEMLAAVHRCKLCDSNATQDLKHNKTQKKVVEKNILK